MKGVQIWSPVRELRSHMLCVQQKKKKKKKIKNKKNKQTNTKIQCHFLREDYPDHAG